MEPRLAVSRLEDPVAREVADHWQSAASKSIVSPRARFRSRPGCDYVTSIVRRSRSVNRSSGRWLLGKLRQSIVAEIVVDNEGFERVVTFVYLQAREHEASTTRLRRNHHAAAATIIHEARPRTVLPSPVLRIPIDGSVRLLSPSTVTRYAISHWTLSPDTVPVRRWRASCHRAFPRSRRPADPARDPRQAEADRAAERAEAGRDPPSRHARARSERAAEAVGRGLARRRAGALGGREDCRHWFKVGPSTALQATTNLTDREQSWRSDRRRP